MIDEGLNVLTQEGIQQKYRGFSCSADFRYIGQFNEVEIPLDYNKELNININSNLFKYLTNIQNEVHRFTINFHKQIRKKDLRSSILDDVPGIGDKRKRALLNKYENINNIKNSSIDELSKIIPNNVAQNLKNYLKKIDV